MYIALIFALAGVPNATSSSSLDIAFLLSCTYSMAINIDSVKMRFVELVDNIKRNPSISLRIAFVGYRNIDATQRLVVSPFSESLDI